ncbi:beta-phosphoglucomutase family hydrolase [Desulfosalsimonas propionicica]|uniref:Beta-phosphoglucomutase family hydrolase n=1 Tax=Desulfosalsimonas propionicica TaxID=332175 RepID=A0A7W0C6S8_9BACT|nr:beta-phosphoglucomutase family hydrolase [Desulfosalsimonas propionicica]MBA2880177.1 beta-phosphoglucomutase family hydrolase [Desulfosalsimonas propionicica]
MEDKNQGLGPQGVVLDLDGVITRTAAVHGRAWKDVFDAFLKEQDKDFSPFTDKDYLTYVDGKPRYDGVSSFLESRGISLAFGDPDDPPGDRTVCGLGNKKNERFNDLVRAGGVEVFDTTVTLIKKLKQSGTRLGVASSSKNCRQVLEAAGLLDLFEVRVDGVVSAELGLKGKPAPDIFITACQRLGVAPVDAVVVEDAVSGVQAGRNGGFGMVIGVARETDPAVLLKNGADRVVRDMGEISPADIRTWFETGLPEDLWSVTFHDYDPSLEKTRETLLTAGNGYFATRGAMEESAAGEINYPGTYMAGVFNCLTSTVSGKDIENEDFVNCPNWLPVNFRIGSGPWMDINAVKIESICRRLDFQTGILHRDMTVADAMGRRTRIVSERIISMADPHVCGLRYSLTPINYDETITFSAAVNGDVINDGVERYRDLEQQHLTPVEQTAGEDTLLVRVRTAESDIEIAAGTRAAVVCGEKIHSEVKLAEGRGELRFSVPARKNQPVCMEKLAAFCTSADGSTESPATRVFAALENTTSFDALKSASIHAWSRLWKEMDIRVSGDRFSQKMLRLHMYHLLVTASPHNTGLDAGMPARGLHGEAYRGHIFWDELFVMPFYDLHFADIARSLLMYRYRRLDAARAYAREHGFSGAMFPWQSGRTGTEQTQTVHLNPMTGQWGPDNSSLQRHVSLAVAFNTWQYFHITHDLAFLENFGAEMFFEICRFWASKARWDNALSRYRIHEVMGPDEFHEKYPDKDKGGLTDNAYTNLMVHWVLTRAAEIYRYLGGEAGDTLCEKIRLSVDEIEKWAQMAQKLNIVMRDGLIAQFDGYFSLKELDWDHYRSIYGDIHRMDRILKKEGKNPDAYKAAKQADVLMAFFTLGEDAVKKMLASMGYGSLDNLLEKNFDYYMARTSHGSTLSRVVHAALARRLGRKDIAWQFYQEALSSDYIDIQGGTTKEGIHTGVMAATVLMAMSLYGGLRTDKDILAIDPALPGRWEKITFGLWFQKHRYAFEITKNKVILTIEGSEGGVIPVEVKGKTHHVSCGVKTEFPL